ncbi:MAG: glycerophosphodiester phosphodiesterase family protein [Leptospiraceae bacterium]|nr:glycerophosphodiester phosphodiesterase family protein [Leptospiraceae bacterium]
MLIIAHRGLSGDYPENTILSFRKAVEFEIPMIELDITLSSDLVPVVIHDDSLDRTTSGSGLVREKEISELKSLDAGVWFHKDFIGERIPTLDEVLTLIKDSETDLNIEIKSGDYDLREIERIALSLVEKYALVDRVVFSSFDKEILVKLRKLSPKLNLAYLIENEVDSIELIKFYEDFGLSSINISKELVGTELHKKIYDLNLPVLVYTINHFEEYYELQKWNIKGIFTNYATYFQEIIS